MPGGPGRAGFGPADRGPSAIGGSGLPVLWSHNQTLRYRGASVGVKMDIDAFLTASR